MKKAMSFALAFIMFINMLVFFPVPSSASSPPVWKIAFVVLPSYKDSTGEESKPIPIMTESFFEAADQFEEWIETVVEYPLDIQVTKISSTYKMADAKLDTTGVGSSVNSCDRSYFDPAGYEAYSLDEYDTVVWGVPQSYQSRARDNINGACVGDSLWVGMVYDPPEVAIPNTFRVIRHEFMHVIEWWHGGYLGYKLPAGYWFNYEKNVFEWLYDPTAPVPTAAIPYNVKDDLSWKGGYSPSHHPKFYGYLNELDFFTDWLNNRVSDPRYGMAGHTLEYLGMTEEMWWQDTPSKVGFENIPDSPNDSGGCEEDFNEHDWDTDLASDMAAYKVRSISVKNAYIDLDNEVFILPTGYNVSAYSLNGGVNWKALNGGDVSKIKLGASVLSKMTNIMLTNSYDAKTKSPTRDANVIIFPTIQARPRTNTEKLKPNYSIEANSSGATTGNWVFSPSGKGVESVYDGYEVALSSNHKTPDTGWQKMPAEGIEVLPYTEKAATWLVRSAPVVDYVTGVYIPASKIWKVKPAVQKKPSNIKANYAKETIALRKGMAISWNDKVYVAQKSERYSISEILDATSSGEPQTIKLWMVATEKAPASAVQVYKLAMRATLEPRELEVKNGKITTAKDLEFLNSEKNTWGNIPRFRATQTVNAGVRLKSTVKADGKDDTEYFAKSFPLDLIVTYGEYMSGRSVKLGIVKAEVANISGG